MSEFEKNCLTCRFGQQDDGFCYPCTKCDNSYSSWESCIWLTYWLSSFDTDSATKCFEAVNIMKMKIAQEEMHEADKRLLNSDWGEMEVQE